MAEDHPALARVRERARYSQDDVGAALGVSRTMVSYWEAGTRSPNDRQVAALARLYGVDVADLVEGRDVQPAGADLAGMLLRENEVDPRSVPGVQEFVQFLARFAELSRISGIPIRGLTQSPYVYRSRFTQSGDARRKAEEVRSHLDLGMGPIPDVDAVCEQLGITVYRAPLGADLRSAPSGAFLNHPEVGFSVLVNLDMTPGRRRFTVAHEIAHALFHSSEERWVISQGSNPREAFADAFAGELLMPSEGVRRFLEETGLPPRITAAVDAIHVQRHFLASWPMTLVRLRQMKAVSSDTYSTLRDQVRPVALARSLGYAIEPEEYQQDTERWRIRKFPRPFLRMLRQAVINEVMSPPSAASFAGLALPDLVQILGQPLGNAEDEPPFLATEFAEFEETGVV